MAQVSRIWSSPRGNEIQRAVELTDGEKVTYDDVKQELVTMMEFLCSIEQEGREDENRGES